MPLIPSARATTLAMLAIAAGSSFAQVPATPAPPPAASVRAELVYRLLLGDVALQRGEPGLAARAYLDAARGAATIN